MMTNKNKNNKAVISLNVSMNFDKNDDSDE
jgi:hypothetical protein